MRLLLVEDDPVVGSGLQVGLVEQGYTVDWAKDGRQAELALGVTIYDLMVLDLGLPVRMGIDVLKELRGNGNTLPVLILTAQDSVADRVAGLDVGADDYLTKPFDLDELFARLRSLARRKNQNGAPVLRHGNIAMDPAAHAITRDGQAVKLSRREFNLLRLLLENRGTVLSKSRLEDGLYGWNEEVESNTVEVHIHNLRRKLGSSLIQNIRGVGYIIIDGS